MRSRCADEIYFLQQQESTHKLNTGTFRVSFSYHCFTLTARVQRHPSLLEACVLSVCLSYLEDSTEPCLQLASGSVVPSQIERAQCPPETTGALPLTALAQILCSNSFQLFELNESCHHDCFEAEIFRGGPSGFTSSFSVWKYHSSSTYCLYFDRYFPLLLQLSKIPGSTQRSFFKHEKRITGITLPHWLKTYNSETSFNAILQISTYQIKLGGSWHCFPNKTIRISLTYAETDFKFHILSEIIINTYVFVSILRKLREAKNCCYGTSSNESSSFHCLLKCHFLL